MKAVMPVNFPAKFSERLARLVAIFGLSAMAAGCNPVSMVAKIGVKVVGDAVNDADVSQKSQELMGKPVAAADAEFGKRIQTLQESRSTRLMITYPVKDDVLNMFRWAVETERGQIVALAKLQNNPDGGQDLAEKLVLKAIVDGKTPAQVESHDWFKNRVLSLRDPTNGNTYRVYDTSIIPNFMGAKYCVLEFSPGNICQSVRIVGVPASTPGSSLG